MKSEEVKRVWEGDGVKDVVQRLGMKGSNSLGRGTSQRFFSRTWDEGLI